MRRCSHRGCICSCEEALENNWEVCPKCGGTLIEETKCCTKLNHLPFPCVYIAGHNEECAPWDPPLEGMEKMPKKKRIFQISGQAFMTFTVDDTHPHFGDEDYLRHEALDAWRNADPKVLEIDQKPYIEEV